MELKDLTIIKLKQFFFQKSPGLEAINLFHLPFKVSQKRKFFPLKGTNSSSFKKTTGPGL